MVRKNGRYGSILGRSLLSLTIGVLIFFGYAAADVLAFSEQSRLTEFVPTYTEPFLPGGTYDSDIPTPEAILGFAIGSQPCKYQEMVSYFDRLAQSSPLAELREYGTTYEGRALYYLIISSEENMNRLEEIQNSVGKLADPSKIGQEREALSLIEKTPVVAWMAYSVHGDELSSTDAAVQFAYQLVAGTDSLTRKIRENVITIIDPLQNPDGRERCLKQLETWSGAVPNTDDQSIQQGGFWPWGRGNHYLFDLNRDWFALTQPETRAKIKAILQWNPQLLIDSHEMGPLDTYLFFPPREPFHPSMSSTIKKWWDIFARDQAKAFDRYGWSYYTRSWVEMWYPGYADSWILYTGGVGILYEQAGVRGSAVRQKDGKILTFRESVHHQFVSSMVNLGTAAENRKELLEDFYKQKKKAIEGNKNSIQGFVFVPSENQSRADELVENLLLQGIAVQTAEEDFLARNVQDFWGGSYPSKEFPKGTYIISMDQPLRPLIEAILEFDPRMSQSFLEEERHELEKRKKSKLYEVSSWCVPMGYDVETYCTKDKVRASTEKVTQISSPEGKALNPNPKYGYLIDYSDDKAVHALIAFVQQGFNARTGLKPFSIEGKQFPGGSILLRNEGNPESLHDFANEVARETGVTIYGVNTALSEEGPDLGGNDFRLLELPRIGLFAGSPIDFTCFGSIWHLLDRRLGMRLSSLDINGFNQVDLDKYNVLILPAVWGPPQAYTRIIGKGGVEKLRKWIEAGGTFIAIGTGAAFAADTTVKLSRVRLRRQVLDKIAEYKEAVKLEEQAERPVVDSLMLWDYPAGAEGESEETRKAEQEPRLHEGIDRLKARDERQRIFKPQGVIVRADLDSEHWLSSGMKDKVPVILYTDFAFMSKSPVQTVARLAGADSLRLSGLLWPEARERWAKTAYLTRERLGKGQIILCAGQPNFRGYFHGSERLLISAILFGPGLGVTRPAPWQ